ncbi:hypothetical protein N656DRAFT_470270 [Canariomyces notabilis]|uniref:Uncharacterized protein n=1 Tax=Canariomyces notabilis TaxID=2074819 RepID=A0AAN6T7J2_9PEZI|nr:hypothetical protein N656DRAFT_470270 [Canariomyces arenarius]
MPSELNDQFILDHLAGAALKSLKSPLFLFLLPPCMLSCVAMDPLTIFGAAAACAQLATLITRVTSNLIALKDRWSEGAQSLQLLVTKLSTFGPPCLKSAIEPKLARLQVPMAKKCVTASVWPWKAARSSSMPSIVMLRGCLVMVIPSLRASNSSSWSLRSRITKRVSIPRSWLYTCS